MSAKTYKTPQQIPKRFKGEDDLLAALRDVHTRFVAVIERPEFVEWISADGGDVRQTVEEIQAAQRLLYELRVARAIVTNNGQTNETTEASDG
jgi:hypothetical protein